LAGVAATFLGAAFGCSSSPTGPGLKLQVAELAADLTCNRSNAGVPFKPLLREGTLRLSVVRRDTDGPHLQCDLTAMVPTDKPSIDLGPVDRARIDVYAELFDTSGMLVLSGAALGNANVGTDGNPQNLPLFPVGGFSCPASLMSTGRAFHSATLLKSGEVLLIGGIESVPGYGPDVFGVIGSAEIYDPRKGTFVGLTGAVTPRAFHQASVLSASDTQVRVLVYGGVTATARLPVLAVTNSASTIRLGPAGTATPAGAEVLVYDLTSRTITSTPVQLGSHSTAFAGGAAMPDGSLVVAGGATFTAVGAFNKNNPATLNQNSEVAVAASGNASAPPSFAFSPSSMPPPWLLGPSVTPLSASTAVALGAQVPPSMASPINMLALQIGGLPQAVNFASAAGATLMGSPTVYHTATRLGAPLGSGSIGATSQILVTGGFVMTAQPPQGSGQPPPAASAVRLYTVHDPGASMNPIDYQAIAVYGPSGTCGASDGHYRPAGFEAAALTPSGQKVLVTGGTPTVNYSAPQCLDCESDTAANKLLCVLSQTSIYDAAAQTFTSGPKLSLGRMGHQQTTLLDGNILVTGGLIRPGGDATDATPESEIYNPRTAAGTGVDPEDPVTAILDSGQKSMRMGMGLASPCPTL
jgi:hypothetical protein